VVIELKAHGVQRQQRDAIPAMTACLMASLLDICMTTAGSSDAHP